MKPVPFDEHKIAELLDRTTWANDLTWSDLERLGPYFKAYKAQKGQMLIKEGEAGNFMGLIIEGKVEIIKHSGDKGSRLAILNPSQTFGELSIIDGGTCSASARAATDTILLITDKDHLHRLSQSHPELSYRVLWRIAALLSKRLRKTSGELIDYL